MTDIDKLCKVFTEIGVKHTRARDFEHTDAEYVFIGTEEMPKGNHTKKDLYRLLYSHNFFEFEDGKIASY